MKYRNTLKSSKQTRQSMKIKVSDFVPKTFGKRKFFVEDLEDKVVISAKRTKKYGSNPNPIVLPKEIEINERFSESIGLYVGDGKMTEKDMSHTEFTNKDEDIIKFMFDFFREIMHVPEERFSITLYYRNGIENIIKERWSNLLNVSSSKFRIVRSDRHRCECVDMQINSTIFRIIFFNIIKRLLVKFKNNKTLRRGFLRGYFAAEGTIGFNSKENFINYIGFSYDAKTEKSLVSFCLDCLKREKINMKIVERDRDGLIQITRWNNYYKLWKIGMFDRCIRKKQRFHNILKSRRIYCVFYDNFRRDLFDSTNMTQRQISKIIGSWQGNICRIIDGTHLPSINQIKSLLRYSKFSEEDILINIKSIRVGPSTHIEDEEFIKHIFSLV